MALTFLDADVLIQFLRRHPPTMRALSRMQEEGAEFAIASINVAEVLRGAQPPNRDHAAVAALLQALTEVPAGPRVARRYGQVMAALDRAGRKMPEVDGLVAATVLSEGGRLVSGNKRHFERVAGLDLVVMPKA